jgi:hypothetical protein
MLAARDGARVHGAAAVVIEALDDTEIVLADLGPAR